MMMIPVTVDMKSRKVPLTAVTYTSLIAELTKLKMLDRILEFALQESDDQTLESQLTNKVQSPLFPISAKSITTTTMTSRNHEQIALMKNNQKLSQSDAVIKGFISKLLSNLMTFEDSVSEVELYIRRERLDMDVVSSLQAQKNNLDSFLSSLSNVKQILDLLKDSTILNEIQSNQGLSFDNATKDSLIADCVTILRGKDTVSKLLGVLSVVAEFLANNSASHSITNTNIISKIKKLLHPEPLSMDALTEYEGLRTKGLTPDANLYANVVESLYEMTVNKTMFRENNLEQQLRRDDLFRLYLVFQEMRYNSRIQIDAPVYNTLIDACAGAGDVERALETLLAMREAGVSPTVITYTSLIKACEIHGGSDMIELAEELFAEMQQRSNHFTDFIAPTHVTYQHLMQVHLTASDHVNTTRVIELFNDMLRKGVTLSLKACRLCIRASAMANNSDVALKVLNIMRKNKGLSFDYHSWYMTMKLCRNRGLYEEEALIRDEILSKDMSLLQESMK